ncbi:uncharacterized protein LOC129412584 [Boleophthalmus pectinirostris]|uniref:uncharacterized protein LOC129412584 n=1 Tax=Boleophthalmus pectinirostris TaxID=150288 RepID=UPI00242FAE39|nr:uncharacterized protein LOC129412584 [Boleophthalmus pectinirostris]
MAFSYRYSISQLRRLRPAAPPGPLSSILNKLGLLRRPRYIHRGSGRKFIFHLQTTGSATNIPSLWSHVARLTRHQSTVVSADIKTGNTARSRHSSASNTARSSLTRLDRRRGADSSLRGVDFKVLRSVQRFTPQALVKFELFNVQSINNKSSLIEEHIREKGLDFMCLTETWHQSQVYSALNEACPPGYTYLEVARSTGHRGGGLAVIHRQHLELSSISLPPTSSCECLAFKCKPPFPVTVLLIYRPPKPNSAFIPEMADLLSTLCTTSANTIILGDINIHVDSPSCKPAADFLQLLDTFNLQQHVDVPTHSRGHTLDLVISNSAPISNLQVYDLGVSDHKVVSMELPFPSPHFQTQAAVSIS